MKPTSQPTPGETATHEINTPAYQAAINAFRDMEFSINTYNDQLLLNSSVDKGSQLSVFRLAMAGTLVIIGSRLYQSSLIAGELNDAKNIMYAMRSKLAEYKAGINEKQARQIDDKIKMLDDAVSLIMATARGIYDKRERNNWSPDFASLPMIAPLEADNQEGSRKRMQDIDIAGLTPQEASYWESRGHVLTADRKMIDADATRKKEARGKNNLVYFDGPASGQLGGEGM